MSYRITFAVLVLTAGPLQAQDAAKPNFVIIFTDDQGYQDLGCFGSPNIKTPRIDQMAKEGMKLTSFYAQTVCGPSRAAIMTGCYPMRVGRADNGVAPHPKLALAEITIAEVLKSVGYATGMFGKWDLAGHSQDRFSHKHLPRKQGFDYSFCTPSSNDRRVNLMRNGVMIEKKTDMSTLTRRYTDEAIKFIDRNAGTPFFVYLAHTMPHVKLAVSKDFRGKSKGGLYGDVIEEIDFNVGLLLHHLKAKGLDENTYVTFTSDNGPWWIKGPHGGHALPLRGAKTSTWEGGFRVPFVVWAPGRVPADRKSDQVTATIDMLPTLAKLAGAKIPNDRVIDGLDISGIIHGKRKQLDRTFFFYQHKVLRAVRHGKWKLHAPHTANEKKGLAKKWLRHIKPSDRVYFDRPVLYDLEKDIGEKTDISAQHPKVVARLLKHLEWARKDIGDLNGRGKNARPLGIKPNKSSKATKKSKRKRKARYNECHMNLPPNLFPASWESRIPPLCIPRFSIRGLLRRTTWIWHQRRFLGRKRVGRKPSSPSTPGRGTRVRELRIIPTGRAFFLMSAANTSSIPRSRLTTFGLALAMFLFWPRSFFRL